MTTVRVQILEAFTSQLRASIESEAVTVSESDTLPNDWAEYSDRAAVRLFESGVKFTPLDPQAHLFDLQLEIACECYLKAGGIDHKVASDALGVLTDAVVDAVYVHDSAVRAVGRLDGHEIGEEIETKLGQQPIVATVIRFMVAARDERGTAAPGDVGTTITRILTHAAVPDNPDAPASEMTITDITED